MKYLFLSPALGEVVDAAEYYEEKIPGLGAGFIDELDAAIERILRFPQAWGRLSEECRHCNLRRFPYTVIFEIEPGDRILIVSVFHQSREPSSWRKNL